MPKYAIVETSDARYLAGVNGQLNALKYYGCDDIEFHLIHTFPDKDGYIESAQKVFPNLVATKISDLIDRYGEQMGDTNPKISKSTMKFWRYLYPLIFLQDYDAICILDADRQIVNDLRPYFDITARSGMILLAKNDYSEAEWDTYDAVRAMQAQPPLYCNPYFATPEKFMKIFPLIPQYARKHSTGDMHAVNLTLLDTGLISEMFLLPNWSWVFTELAEIMLRKREIKGKQYLGLHNKGDLMFTYHRRFWGVRDCVRYANGREPRTKKNAINNVKLMYEFTRFFNLELYHPIEWIWGDYDG